MIRRFQNFSQKDQKLFYNKKKCNFFKDQTSGTSDAPIVHLGHLSHISKCPRPLHSICPLPPSVSFTILGSVITQNESTSANKYV